MAQAGLRKRLYSLIDEPWMDAQFARTLAHRSFVRDVDLAIAAATKDPVNWPCLVGGCLLYASLGAISTQVHAGALSVLAQVGDENDVASALGYADLTHDLGRRADAY